MMKLYGIHYRKIHHGLQITYALRLKLMVTNIKEKGNPHLLVIPQRQSLQYLVI